MAIAIGRYLDKHLRERFEAATDLASLAGSLDHASLIMSYIMGKVVSAFEFFVMGVSSPLPI